MVLYNLKTAPNAFLLKTYNWHEFYDINYHLGNINLVISH